MEWAVSRPKESTEPPRGGLRHGEGRDETDAGGGPGNVAQRDVPGEAGEWSRRAGPHLRQDADALHQDSAGRQGDGGPDAVRPVPGADHFSREMNWKLKDFQGT